MYSTAPNFAHQISKKIELIRSRGNKEGELFNRSSSKDLKEVKNSESTTILHKKRLSSQTMETMIQTERNLDPTTKAPQRPIKRILEKNAKKDASQPSLTVNELTKSTYI